MRDERKHYNLHSHTPGLRFLEFERPDGQTVNAAQVGVPFEALGNDDELTVGRAGDWMARDDGGGYYVISAEEIDGYRSVLDEELLKRERQEGEEE